MGANNSSPVTISQQTSDDPSLSIVSIDDTLFSASLEVNPDSDSEFFLPAASLSFRASGGDVPPQEFVTLAQPGKSDRLANPDLFISDSALIKLESTANKKKKKNKKCCCFGQRSSTSGNTKSENMMMGISSYDSINESSYASPEMVFTIGSGELNADMVVNPVEVYPLSVVTSLEMSPSEVRAKPVKVRRTTVPDKPDKPMSLWGLLKSAIGKDLTKMPLPVNFSEPLSMLQRLTEDYEYSAILDRAALLSDPLEQMAFVAAFTVSSYASCAYRTAKPFNPLLGETYECDRTDDLGWRVIAEQVCHHPPIASLHCESAMGWVQWQQFTMKSNFKGTYLEIHPLGIAHLRFKNDDNHYTWRKVSTIVRNLYMGKMYIEQEGEMDIFNHTTGDKCHMKYSCGGMFSRDRTVTGKIYNRANEPKWEIKGAWDTELTAARLDDKGKPNESFRILWQKKELPRDADKRYNFSVFACQLNEKEEGVAPTDSRNRPDQRFMEDAKWDEANTEKVRLEDRQRQSRKARLVEGAANYSTSSNINTRSMRSSHGSPTGPDDGVELYYTPCWFARQRDPLSGQYIYMFNGEYWNCKESGDWSRCPRIYDK